MEKKKEQSNKPYNPGPMWPGNLLLIGALALIYALDGFYGLFVSIVFVIASFAFLSIF